jgi:hypothetical protein
MILTDILKLFIQNLLFCNHLTIFIGLFLLAFFILHIFRIFYYILSLLLNINLLHLILFFFRPSSFPLFSIINLFFLLIYYLINSFGRHLKTILWDRTFINVGILLQFYWGIIIAWLILSKIGNELMFLI